MVRLLYYTFDPTLLYKVLILLGLCFGMILAYINWYQSLNQGRNIMGINNTFFKILLGVDLGLVLVLVYIYNYLP